MTNVTKATETKAAPKFKWNEERTSKAVELYQAKLEQDGATVASSGDYLMEIAVEVGAPSDKSVRGKLTKEGVYVKPEQVASTPKTNKVRKLHCVRAIANMLHIDEEEIDTLQNGKQDALTLVCNKLGVSDIMAASSKEFDARPEMLIHAIMQVHGVDIDDLETYFCELAESEEETEE